MLDFPTATPGQTYTAAGVTWIWDGAKWLPSGLSPTVAPGINDNRIINGDMRIDQRNNGVGGTANVYTVDRWLFSGSVASKGTWSRYNSTAPGFPYHLGFSSSSAYAVLAGDYFCIQQLIEADMIGDFAWGTANAQPVTLSFWANSSLTGTFGGSLQNYAFNRSYPFSYSIPAANTWTKIVVTIPGDTAGTWVMSGNAGSLAITFSYGMGSTRSGSAGAWASANYLSATGAVSVVGVNGASFSLTGVKLEIGSVATPFNRQSLAKSMADCQRYYQTLGAGQVLATGYNTAGGIVYTPLPLPVAMRAAPTVAYSGMGYGNASTITVNTVSSNLLSSQLTITGTGSGYANGAVLLSAEL